LARIFAGYDIAIFQSIYSAKSNIGKVAYGRWYYVQSAAQRKVLRKIIKSSFL